MIIVYWGRRGSGHNIEPPYEPSYAVHTYLKFPLLVKDRKKFFKEAEKEKIELGDWFISPIHPITKNLEYWHYKYGENPIAEKISQHIIDLPTLHRSQNPRLIFGKRYFWQEVVRLKCLWTNDLHWKKADGVSYFRFREKFIGKNGGCLTKGSCDWLLFNKIVGWLDLDKTRWFVQRREQVLRLFPIFINILSIKWSEFLQII